MKGDEMIDATLPRMGAGGGTRVARRGIRARIHLGFVLLCAWLASAGSLAADPASDITITERDDIIGTVRMMTTAYEDTMLDIARDNGLGFTELMAVNLGVDPWIPGEGTRIVLPTAHILPDAPRRGIVVNIAELRLYYYPPDGGPVVTMPIGVGRDGFSTPFGTTKVTRKAERPTWYPTENTRADRPELPAVVPPGPDNPLGEYAIYLGWPLYLIHGTNQPWGVGRRVSRGCIRLYPEDIERLFPTVPVGTPVTVVSQPVKLGWRDNNLFIEVNPSLTQVDQIEEQGIPEPDPVPELADPDRILAAAGDEIWRLDWNAINQALERRQGIPIQITRDARLSRRGAAAGWDAAPGGAPSRAADEAARMMGGHGPDSGPTVIRPGIGRY
jgi:L,D-transpeptidase ErfK/SrfK